MNYTRKILLLCILLPVGTLTVHHLTKTPKTKWVFGTWGASISWAGSTLFQNKLLLTSYDNHFIALDKDTGSKVWEFNLAKDESTSHVANGTDGAIYLASKTHKEAYHLRALNGADGTLLWENKGDMKDPLMPVLEENRQIICDGGDKVVSLDANTKARLWTFQPPTSDKWMTEMPRDTQMPGEKPLYIESMKYANGKIYVVFGQPYKQLYALDALTGKLEWKVTLFERKGFPKIVLVWQTQMSVASDGSVIIAENGFRSKPNGELRSYDGITGRLQWKQKRQTEGLCTYGERIYGSNSVGEVMSLNARTGKEIWRVPLGDVNGVSHSEARNGRLYLSTTNYLYALDLTTGKVIWNEGFGFLPDLLSYGNSISITSDTEGTVYATSHEGHIYALQ